MTVCVVHGHRVLFGHTLGHFAWAKEEFGHGSECAVHCPLLAWNRTVEDGQRDLVDPAVKGTKNVLSAVAKSLDTVKRVVLTSSFAGAHQSVCTSNFLC